MRSQGEQSQRGNGKRLRAGRELLQVDRIQKNARRTIRRAEEFIGSRATKTGLVNYVVRPITEPAHGAIESFRLGSRPTPISDAVLIPDEFDSSAMANLPKVTGKRRLCAADEVQNIERLGIRREGVAEMEKLDGSTVEKLATLEYAAKGKNWLARRGRGDA